MKSFDFPYINDSPIDLSGREGAPHREDIRDVDPGESYYALAQQSRGGRLKLDGMFIAIWRTKKAAQDARDSDPDLVVVKCLKPITKEVAKESQLRARRY
jgi:hypothetical protein